MIKSSTAVSPRLMAWLALLLIVCWQSTAASNVTEQSDSTTTTASTQVEEPDPTTTEDDSIDPHYACLFPSFSLTIGVIAFWILSRYARALPYTGVMFLLGTLMGIGAELWDSQNDLDKSIRLWVPIDGAVLLLVFLPGLIFKDSYGLNVNLFRIALWQCFHFAFPMVLGGTVLTALVAYYIFPYGWSFSLAMTFGAILSATDPVAVCFLMEQVGAPPRLKVHISGEALLNDGSAIVFFSIFVKKYLLELDVPGLGEEVDLAKGISLFFHKSLGGMAIGIFFGLCIVTCFYLFHHRFNREENVVEVVASFALAYVGYYTADAAWEASGVLCNMASGLTVKLLGTGVQNEPKLLNDFWTLVEYILNTVLFTLGGTVWGAMIANGEENGFFVARDWGYLIVLYLMLLLIRIVLFVASYPLIVRTGLSTCWEEQVFQVWGGLRGAVGIAMALALDNLVTKEAQDPEYVRQTHMLFAMVGGVAFMTLTINGLTAGPLLNALHLADSTETRKKIVNTYHGRIQRHAVDEFVRLMTQSRFRAVNFATVKHHVPLLASMTRSQLEEVIRKHRDSTPPDRYQAPHLDRVLPHLKFEESDKSSFYNTTRLESAADGEHNHNVEALDLAVADRIYRNPHGPKRRKRNPSNLSELTRNCDTMSVQEIRTLFLSLLGAAYKKGKYHGELSHQQYLAVALEQSLDLTADEVAKGKPLADWAHTYVAETPVAALLNRIKKSPLLMRCLPRDKGKYAIKQLNIERAIAFIAAHEYAEDFIEAEFLDAEGELTEPCKMVLAESNAQCQLAESVLLKYSAEIVSAVVSHKFSILILTSAIHMVGKLVDDGLLTDTEAEELVEQFEIGLTHVNNCNESAHPGGITVADSENESGKSTP